MSSASYHLSVSAARADALFASTLQRSDEPSAWQVRQAIAVAVAAHGSRGCTARVAQTFGEYPEAAVTRMRWARTTVADVFGRSRLGRAQSARAHRALPLPRRIVAAGEPGSPRGRPPAHPCAGCRAG